MTIESLFGITIGDLQDKIMPNADAFGVRLGDGLDLPDATIEKVVAEAEAEVLGNLHDRYQKLLRGVDGEVLTSCAAGGETEFTVSLAPVVAGSLRLWLNYGACARAWVDRRPSDAMTGSYTVTLSSGVVVLGEALSAGDVLWATYEHTAGSQLVDLRRDAMGLAAAEIGRRLAALKTVAGFERFVAWEMSAREHLRDLQRKGGRSIELLERVVLVQERRGVEFRGIFT